MAPKPEPPEEAPDESWMATFADMVTLLMAFFVMLLNFSKIDIPKFEAVAAGIANEIGMGENVAEQPVELMRQAVEDVVVEMQADHGALAHPSAKMMQRMHNASEDHGLTHKQMKNITHYLHRAMHGMRSGGYEKSQRRQENESQSPSSREMDVACRPIWT